MADRPTEAGTCGGPTKVAPYDRLTETDMCSNDNKRWQQVVDCDPEADGVFFYAVKTVGVYCRPSCKSRTPLRKNVLFFDSTAAAEQAGFRPCKRCRPDLLNYAPALEIAAKTKQLIDGYWDSRRRIDHEMRELGVSASQLARIFRSEYGMTPAEYLSQVRLAHAKELLEDDSSTIIDVALEVGFESLSAFYRFFKKYTGVTPREYRLQPTQVCQAPQTPHSPQVPHPSQTHRPSHPSQAPGQRNEAP